MKDLLEVRGLSGMAANFLGARKDVRISMRRVNVKHGETVVNVAQQLVPVRSGRTRRSIKYVVSPEGLTVEIFCDPDVFANEGEPYYPPDVEFGTYKSPAQPFLFPAWESDRSAYELDVSQVIKDAHRKFRVR